MGIYGGDFEGYSVYFPDKSLIPLRHEHVPLQATTSVFVKTTYYLVLGRRFFIQRNNPQEHQISWYNRDEHRSVLLTR